MSLCRYLSVLFTGFFMLIATANGLSVQNLRCEYLENPLGIDVTTPRLCWTLQSDERGQKQTAWQVVVASTPKLLAANQGNLWDSGKVVSDQTLHIVYAGSALASRQQCHWKVRTWDKNDQPSNWSKAASWSMGLLQPTDWGNAGWIAFTAPQPSSTNPPATMLRKEFTLSAPARRATVSITSLGLYELWINGQRVGDHLLAPEWTCYKKRIQYQTYDVTSLLLEGANVIGAQLCGGWWSGPLMIMPAVLAPQYCLRLRLDAALDNDTTQTLVSDNSWQATDTGPIRRSEIYYGEVYDATKEKPGWNQTGFTAKGWIPAKTLTTPAGSENAVLVAQPNEPIRVTKEITTVKITQPSPGTYVFDMGQNMVGWCRLHTDAPAGTKISMRFGEALSEDGTVYLANLRKATQINTYTWRGGEATLEPHFTYYGFRYVQVSGLTTPPDTGTLLGRVFHSSSPETGSLSTSSELLNSIIHCVEWVQRANMHSTPTDCPQRDERMGWMGDILSFSQTGIFNRNMAGFFTKWIPDIRDSQADDGRYPDFAPHVSDPKKKYFGTPGWGDAGTVVPWRVYQNYADTRILKEHFESAKRWIDFIHNANPDFLWQKNRGHDFNDWLNGDTLILDGYPRGISEIPKEIFATAFFAHSTEIVAKMATVLGRTRDAATYTALFNSIKSAFNTAYVTSEGRINGDTQSGYALALNFNLIDPNLRKNATSYLLESIAAYKSHPSTGIHSTHRMMMELSKNGQHDEACRLINLRTVPSWGYMVDMGATTIWERWDGYVKGRGFQNPRMNSMNHWALGSVGEWIWRTLAGINPDESHPGFKHIIIHPQPGGGLTWVKGRYESIRGTIISEWSQEGKTFSLHVAIPPNTTATVFVPAKDDANVTEVGVPAAQAKGVSFLRIEDGCAVYAVGSGRYAFVGKE